MRKSFWKSSDLLNSIRFLFQVLVICVFHGSINIEVSANFTSFHLLQTIKINQSFCSHSNSLLFQSLQSTNLIKGHRPIQKTVVSHTNNSVKCGYSITTLHYRKALKRDETKVIELVLANVVAICHNSVSLVIVLLFLLPQLQNKHVSVLIN